MKLYHGTSERLVPRILRRGLQPRGRRASRWQHASAPDRVYLTTAYAPYFAANACRGGERWAIIELDTDRLEPGHLLPDEDWLEQSSRGDPAMPAALQAMDMAGRTRWFRNRAADFAELWSASLDGLGTCAHRGTVMPTAFTRLALIDPRRSPAMALRALDPSISLLNYRLCGAAYRAITRWAFEPVALEDLTVGGAAALALHPPEALAELRAAVAARDGLEVLTLNGATP